MNGKRLALIIGFVLVALGLLVIIYFFFFRPAITGNANVNGNVPGGIPGVGNGNINQIRGNQNVSGLPNANGRPTLANPSEIATDQGPTLVSPLPQLPSVGTRWTLGPNGIQYYDPTTGQFFRSSLDGTSRSLLSSTFYPEVQNVVWSGDGSKAVLSFPDGSKVVVDFPNHKQATLPQEADGFTFSPDATKVAFKFLTEDPDNRYLVTTNTDGSNAQSLERLGENDAFVTPNWSPDGQVVATFQQGAGENSNILFIGQHGENFKSLPVPGRNFIGTWSRDGAHMLFSVSSPNTSDNPALFVVDARGDTIGQNLLDLNITTFADKCTFSRTSANVAYCAVPDHLEPGSGIIRGATTDETDQFYRIDLTTGQRTLLADPVDASGRFTFNAGSLNLSANESTLFFTDAATGKIYQIKLR
jgi:hypothetical protein